MNFKTIMTTAVLVVTFSASASAADADSLYAKDLLKPGTEAPQFTVDFKDSLMNISLSDYRGRYVVLDFWASWCPDCRREIPAVKQLYEEYSKRGVVFIGVSFDTDRKAWTKCIRDNGMKWLQFSELKKWKETQISKDYHIAWIPTLYLIAPDGKVDMATVETSKIAARLSQLPAADTSQDHAPEFIGGLAKIQSYLSGNIVYPPSMAKMGIEGRVVVDFVVDRDGSVKVIRAHGCEITNPGKLDKFTIAEQTEMKRQCSLLFAKEAARVISRMPKWNPGVQYGFPVKVRYSIPVNFRCS
jgi:peroxiredoxin